MYTQHTNKCISDCALLSSPRMRIQQAKSLGSLTSHTHLTDDRAPAPGGWWPAVNYPTPCSYPGMKWDIKTHHLYRWLDSQQHDISRCAVLCDLFNLSFIYFYVKHKHSYFDLYQYVPIYVHHLFIPLASAEFDDSLPFSGASSITLCYVLFPATLPHQLFFHSLSPHLAIYFLVYLSILFPNLYIILFWEFYFLPFSVHVQTNIIYLTLLSLI